MGLSGVFAQMVAVIGDAAIQWRRLQGSEPPQAVGATPTIPAGKPQGRIPTSQAINFPDGIGSVNWTRGGTVNVTLS